MTSHWEKRDRKRSAKEKIKKQDDNSLGAEDSYSRRKRKKRYRPKNFYYDEYVNEKDLE